MKKPLSRPSASAATPTEREQEEQLIAFRRFLPFGVAMWTSFFALDLFVALVVRPETPLAWLALWRFVGSAYLLPFSILMRRRTFSQRTLNVLYFSPFCVGSACIALMAVKFGGLTSPYMHGISLVTIFASVGVPSRWPRALALGLASVLIFPLVMGVAAAVDPAIHLAWTSGPDLKYFGLNYVFVVCTSVVTSVLSHMVWAAHRQVFEARRLGRYRLKVRIGSGGMGEVWMAWDEQARRNVALKILDVKSARRSEDVLRFRREAQVTSSLRSPHTVRVFDFGASDDGVFYMAMELLDGQNLGVLVAEQGPLSERRAVSLVRQACASLGEAHAAGIVHRDVKPENLFVTPEKGGGELLRVLDFGLAKLTMKNDDATLTRAGWVGGTPAFMSPEVCAGQAADARSDIYSLGATLYFLVTGTPPFLAENAAEVMSAHLQRIPDLPSERCGRPIHPELEDLILRCLEKVPEHRPSTVDAVDLVLERIERSLDSGGGSATTPR